MDSSVLTNKHELKSHETEISRKYTNVHCFNQFSDEFLKLTVVAKAQGCLLAVYTQIGFKNSSDNLSSFE